MQLRLIGAGPVGYQIARVLVASGLGTLYVYDNEPPDLALYPSAGVLTSQAEALRSALAEAGTTISTLSHWSKPEAAPLDLTIVACDRPELDRVITDHLLRIDQPHLVVRCWGNGVSVGPLVLAGQTSCLRCADLARSDADPQWPVVLTQLSRLRIESPPALLAWAAVGRGGAGTGISPRRAAGICRRDTGAQLARLRNTAASLASPSQLRLRLAQPYRMGAMSDQPAKPTNGAERHLAADSRWQFAGSFRIPPRGETGLAAPRLCWPRNARTGQATGRGPCRRGE